MFIGRKEELQSLKDQRNKRSASFIAIRGRRRIGKSRLIEEFSKEFSKKYLFTGLPPTSNVTKVNQRQEFIKQMTKQGLPKSSDEDWSDIFWILSKASEKGPTLIVLDEIAWMGSKDPTFLGKLKIAYDQHFEKNPHLILIVASSLSSWLDKNILNDTGFFGRVDLTLTLDELPIKECVKFFGKHEKRISPHEKLNLLGVTGGVPKYLNAIDASKSAEKNIQKLCFSSSGLLFLDFDRIFHDLFLKKGTLYKRIVEYLSSRLFASQLEIAKSVKQQSGRPLSEALSDLVTAGFIKSDHTWSLKTGEKSKLRRYRLSDNYLRFYLKYIAPNKESILKNRLKGGSLFDTLKWETIMGLQFENLVLQNSNTLLNLLEIPYSDVIHDGPFFQTRTQRTKGCQIDYLIQTKTTLYICEVKFLRGLIGREVIQEVEEKINALSLPRRLSCRPVLIHTGGVREVVVESEYFDHIVDWTTLL